MADSMADALAAAGLDPAVYQAELAAAPARLAQHAGDPRECCDECRGDLAWIGGAS